MNKTREEVQAYLDEWEALQDRYGVNTSYCCCMGVVDEEWNPLWDSEEGFYEEEE